MKPILTLLLWVGAVGLSLGQEVPNNERVILDAPINSEFTETRPFISPDGKTIFLSRRESPENVGGHRDYMDIYRSNKLPDGSWSPLQNLGDMVNTKKPDALACIGDDGATLYIFNTARRPKFPLYQTTEVEAGEFSKLQPVLVKDFYNLNIYQDFFVSEKFGVMILAIERKDTKGDQDLYVSFRQPDGTYSEPKHMGASINSRKAEFAPFIGPFGKRLYFASYGFKGKGGADIFVTERKDDTWTNWTRPQNLGDGINSRGQEIYFSFTHNFEYIYIESWDKAHDDRDIIQVLFPEELRPMEDLLTNEETTLAEATTESPGISEELEAAIDAAAQQQEEERNSMQEALASNLSDEGNTTMNLDSTEPTEEETETPPSYALDRPAEESTEEARSSNPSNAPANSLLAVGAGYILERTYNERSELKYMRNLYFESGSSQVSDSYYEHLDRIVSYMEQFPDLTVSIEGHTDVIGSDGWNTRLSEMRASAAAAYIQDKGIDAKRILTTGRGHDVPLASNDDESDGRELNRRVEISLLTANL